MTAPTGKSAASHDEGGEARVVHGARGQSGHGAAVDPRSRRAVGEVGPSATPFSFEVHPAWGAAGGSEDRPAQDATRLRSWLSETVLAAPGPRAPWLDLERARVDEARLAELQPAPTLVLGMGGSALGARAAMAWAAADGEIPSPVRVLDTVDPEVVREHLAWRDRVDARVVVVSKSGTTIEVHRVLDVLFERGLRRAVFVADPSRTPMDERFSSWSCVVDRFDMPADVGGRYSVLTAVGQVPLRCAGLDAHALLDGAAWLRAQWIAEADGERSQISSAPTVRDLDALQRSIQFRLTHPAAVHVVWCYAERLLPYSAWLQQLDNESLGRTRGEGDRVGELMVSLRGPADQHSVAQLLLDGPRDKRVLFVDRCAMGLGGGRDVMGGGSGEGRRGDGDPERESVAASGSSIGELDSLESLRSAEARAAFEAVGDVHPTARLVVPGTGLAALGAAFLRGMLEVVTVGWAMGVDPYGQPAVEAIKRRIREG